MTINIDLGPAQIIYIVLIVIGLLVSAAMHGEPRKGVYSFWTTFIATLLQLFLLYWGGFFS